MTSGGAASASEASSASTSSWPARAAFGSTVAETSSGGVVSRASLGTHRPARLQTSPSGHATASVQVSRAPAGMARSEEQPAASSSRPAASEAFGRIWTPRSATGTEAEHGSPPGDESAAVSARLRVRDRVVASAPFMRILHLPSRHLSESRRKTWTSQRPLARSLGCVKLSVGNHFTSRSPTFHWSL